MLVLSLSVVIGLIVGLLGAGGSIMTTPLFIYAEHMAPVEAIASSLLVVAAASAFALVRHGMRGHIQWRTGFIFGLSGMLSAFVGGQVGAHLPGEILLFAFSIIMAITGFAMIRRRKSTSLTNGHKPRTYRLVLDGALVGFITGIVGAGGGFMVVPALVLFGGLAIKEAIATSLLVVIMKCLGAFAGFALKFNDGALISFNSKIDFDFQVILIAIIGASVGSVVGSLFSSKVKSEKLSIAFGWFVIAMAVFIFFENLNGAITH
jgi:uncharacterized membrane protein YfcA